MYNSFMCPDLVIRFLGTIEIIFKQHPLRLPTRKSTLLFAYLVLHRRQGQERVRLAGMLWPDLPEARARRNLNTEIWRIRSALGDAAQTVTITTTTITFSPPFDFLLDFELLDHLPDDAPLEYLRCSIENYRGDFLAGYYEDWVISVQERLRASYLTALAKLLKNMQAAGDAESAIRYARRILEHEPLQESIHRKLIQLYIETGNRSAALRQYRYCAEILRQELGVHPMEETRSLYRDLMRTFPRGLPEVFVGREKELQSLNKFAAGEDRVLLVLGESGSGKSTLLSKWSAGLKNHIVIHVHCDPRGTGSPFAPVASALRSLLQINGLELIGRLPIGQRHALGLLLSNLHEDFQDEGQLISLSPAQARERLFGAILAVFRQAESSVILFIDDLHAADPDSLGVFQSLLQDLPATRFRLIGAYPSGVLGLNPEHPLLEWLSLKPQRQKLYLSRFTPEETATLLQKLAQTDQPPTALAQRLFEETEGSPLFIVETLRDLFERGTLVWGPSGGWQFSVAGFPKSDIVPGTVESVIRARLMRVPQIKRDILALAAVLGRSFEFNLLLEASQQGEELLQECMDLAMRADLIAEVEDGISYTFTHEKFRTVLLQDLPEKRRKSLFRSAAEALELQAVDPDGEQLHGRLAYYFSMSDRPEASLDYLVSAAGKAEEMHAYQESIRHLEVALEVLSSMETPDKQLVFKIEVNRLRCFQFLGRIYEIDRLALNLMHLGAGLGSGEMAEAELIYGRNLIASGRWGEAEIVLKQALKHARAAGEAGLESGVLLLLATLAYHTRKRGDRTRYLQEALARAEAAQDPDMTLEIRLEMAANAGLPSLRAEGLYQGYLESGARRNYRVFNQFITTLVINMVYDGKYGRAIEIGEEMMAMADEHGLDSLKHSLWRVLARCRIEIGDYREAERLAKHSLSVCRSIGYRYGEMRALACLAAAEAGNGAFHLAMPDFEQAILISNELGARNEWFLFTFFAAESWLRHTHEGALAEAQRLTEALLDAARADQYMRACIQGHMLSAQICLHKDDRQAAIEHSSCAIHYLEEHGHVIGREHHVWYVHARTLFMAGRPDWQAPLCRARESLAKKACSLPQGVLRRGYLHNVPNHREIILMGRVSD